MKNRRCIQTKCSFFVVGGCKSCKKCKAKPFIINPICQKCISCEGVSGQLRFGDDKDLEKNEGEIIEQEILNEIMVKFMNKIRVIERAGGNCIKKVQKNGEENEQNKRN